MPRTKETVAEEKLVTEEKTKKEPVLKICPVNPERFESPTKGTEKASCYDIYLQEDIVIPRGLQNPTYQIDTYRCTLYGGVIYMKYSEKSHNINGYKR